MKVPDLARSDHGKPWIRIRESDIESLLGAGAEGTATAAIPSLGQVEGEPPFASLLKLLSEAQEITEVGMGTVGETPVTTYRIKPAATPVPTTGQPTLAIQPSAPTVEVSIDAEGLPMKTVVTGTSGLESVTFTEQILATDFPLTIEAPPAAETIGLESALSQLEGEAAAGLFPTSGAGLKHRKAAHGRHKKRGSKARKRRNHA